MPSDIDLADYPDIIDYGVFEQILEMDDDPDDRDFSKQIVSEFFDQASETIKGIETELPVMEQNVERSPQSEFIRESMKRLSDLGHFLKGSSSTLGLVKMQRSCEKIQNYGKGLDASGNNYQPDRKKTLEDIQASLQSVKKEYTEAKDILNMFFRVGDE